MGATASISDIHFQVDNNIITDPSVCQHSMLHCWDGVFVCMDCYYRLNDCEEATEKNADRIEEEMKFAETIGDDYLDGLSEEEKHEIVGKKSASRGVKIGFLLYFTQKFNCWN